MSAMGTGMVRRVAVGMVALSLVAAPSVTWGAIFIANENGKVTTQEPIEDDLYTAGSSIDINHAVQGDAVIAGQSITITEVIAGDLTAAGQSISIDGEVADDVRIAGARLSVRQSVGDDVFAAGQSFTLEEEASIGGSAFLAGDTITIDGTIGGDARIGGQARIGSSAVIRGDLLTYGEEPHIDSGATIEGQTRHVAGAEPRDRTGADTLLTWLRRVVTLFVIGLLLLYVLPGYTYSTLNTLWRQPGRSILTSLLWVVLLIPAAIILFISLVGIPLAFVLIFFTAMLALLSSAYAALAAGSWIMRRLTRSQQPDKSVGTVVWQDALLGAVVYESVKLLGVIGGILAAVLALFVLGAMILAMWERLRPQK